MTRSICSMTSRSPMSRSAGYGCPNAGRRSPMERSMKSVSMTRFRSSIQMRNNLPRSGLRRHAPSGFARSALAAGLMLTPALPSGADVRTEAFVQRGAGEVLQALDRPGLSADARAAAFSNYMDAFADMDTVSRFTIGKYVRRFSADDLQRFKTIFRAYALAV